jgi:hypothetical protein
MNIHTANFFYSNYVGYMPEDNNIIACTEAMIEHYKASKLDWAITKIFEVCAKDGILSPMNIPYNIWEEGNLIKHNKFYLHPALRLTNPAPIYDPFTDEIKVSDYYYEINEYFSIDNIYAYIINTTQSLFLQFNQKRNFNTIRYCLNRCKELERRFNIEALDILLTTIDCASNNCKQIIKITDYEEEAVNILLNYKRKLESLNKYKIEWRPPCKLLLN